MKLAVLGLNLLLPLTLVAAEPTSGPVVSSPYWNQGEARDKAVADVIKEVPVAAANATAARYAYYQSNNQLNRASNKIRDDFYASKEYVDASNEVKQAYADYNAAREKAVASVHGGDKYQAAVYFRDKLNEQILDEHSLKEPSLDKLMAIAELKTQAIAPFRQEESKLMADSKEVADAKQKLLKANDKLTQLEKSFKVKVRDNPELADLIQKRSDSRIEFLVSSAYLREVREARNIILKYSEPQRSNYSPYPYGIYGGFPGYNYGFGHGYGIYR